MVSVRQGDGAVGRSPYAQTIATRKRSLSELNSSQEQNKRCRIVDYVLIPRTPKKIQFSPRSTKGQQDENDPIERMNPKPFQAAAKPRQPPSRPHRESRRPRVSYVLQYGEDPEDELATCGSQTAGDGVADGESDSEFEVQFDENVQSSDEESSDDAAPSSEDSDAESEALDVSEDDLPRSKSKSQPPSKQKAERTRTGGESTRIAIKGTSRMLNLSRRGRDDAKGLDTSLAPITEIDDIFEDLTKKALNLGLHDTLNHLAERPLRAATICSGTESPLLALEMIRSALGRLSAKPLLVEHLFSAEIVPYKQAYIERNFGPPIIFRDITEVTEAVNDEIPTATTAYGARVAIPTQVDIVIAGTSCVDFSGLNAHRRDLNIDTGGESSRTWYAVLRYVEKFRPPIVLLENVKNAAWNQMHEDYENLEYEAAGVLVDTKDFYLPHTRQRGYMVCFDKRKLVKDAGGRWQNLMQDFKRFASSPITDFLLPSDVYSVKRDAGLEDPPRDIDWSQCEIRQMDYRQFKRLGNARPFTKWQESGTISVPENGSASWYRKQTERVKDCIDCSILRKALRPDMYDARYKTRIWDLSQNIDRFIDHGAMGITGCITPSGIFFVSDAGRALAPQETLKLQGLPLSKISFTTEASSELQDLAGNAMSSTVVGSAILSALIAGYQTIESRTSSMAEIHERKESVLNRLSQVEGRKISAVATIDHTKAQRIAKAADEAARRCFCEGARGLTDKPMQRCIDCYHTTCKSCGGNPVHNYRDWKKLTSRTPATDFEQELRDQLPLQLAFVLSKKPWPSKHKRNVCQKYFAASEAALESTFNLHLIRRTGQWVAQYTSSKARLELVLHEGRADWRLYALPDRGLAVHDELRPMLEQPIARSSHSQSQWEWRSSKQQTLKLRVTGTGKQVSSWWARNQMPDFLKHKVWNTLVISIEGSASKTLPEIEGEYHHLPNCGTANDSLYKRADADPDARPIYLFKDPTRTGPPDQDCFVFAHGKEQLDYGEVRPILGRMEPAWKPWLGEKGASFSAPTLNRDQWTPFELRMKSVDAAISLSRNDNVEFLECETAELVAGCSVPLGSVGHNGLGTKQLKIEEKGVLEKTAWLLEALRRSLPTGEWKSLDLDKADCSTCAPAKPALRWRLDLDGETIKPYEDPSNAAAYERSIKARPAAMVLETESSDKEFHLRFGMNVMTLAHRARARLPVKAKAVKVDWRVQPSAQSRAFTFKPFNLTTTKNIRPWTKNVKMTCPLFPKQQLVLAWMKQQEHGRDFTIEEADEATLPNLGWKLEVQVTGKITVRGGICADHPGFGKTVTSLALIHSQFIEQDSQSIVEELKLRQIDNMPTRGLLPVQATLIVAPGSLVRQWQSEIDEKLGYEAGVLAIHRAADLDKFTINDFEQANIIIVNRRVLADEQYMERVAAFAAVPGPSTTSGRSFAHWLAYACNQIPEHLKLLHDKGIQSLRNHIKSRYKTRIESEEFRAIVPSRRLRGKEFDNQSKSNNKAKSVHLKPAASSVKTEGIDRPLFEMFYFNRLIVDEFHDLDAKEYAAVVALKADKSWGLSATPRMNDFYDIAQMAGLIGVPLRLGSVSPDVMKIKNIRTLQRELTDFERFDMMRQSPSDAVHTRIHELDQLFLDTFARQNIMDFDEMIFDDHLVPVALDADHLTAYTELSQHLNSQDMRIRKAKGEKSGKRTDSEQRLLDAIADSQSAEEALSRNAAFFIRDRKVDSKEGVSHLARLRQIEIDATKKALRDAVQAAERTSNPFLKKIYTTQVKDGALGDDQVISVVDQIMENMRSGHSAKSNSKRKTDQLEDDDSDRPAKESKGGDKARSLAAEVNKLVKRLLISTRSHRYVHNVQRILEQDSDEEAACDSAFCDGGKADKENLAVSAFCGHVVCNGCHARLREQHDSLCPAEGCGAAMHDYHLLRSEKLQASIKTTEYGAKIDAMLGLLRTIQEKGDQAIVFVQYANQLAEVGRALKESEISAVVVKESSKAGDQIAGFRESSDTAIVLNASDETAAGSNLQNANHIIFLSPLLRNTQYLYESTMAQAIGRVRRHGQTKEIHVYRVVALDTIDVDILEHRERRVDALTEYGAPSLAAPKLAAKVSNGKAVSKGERERERTQLVRQGAKFSLRPRSWLISGDAKQKQFVGRAQIRGRVSGWEDFSALVKFSRAYTEDDD